MPARQRRLAWQRRRTRCPAPWAPSPSTARLPLFAASKRRHRRLFTPDDSTLSQIEADAGQFAGIIARRTSLANIGPHGVHCARRRYPDFAHKGTATVSIAAHAPVPVVDEGTGNPIKVRFGLQGKPRPIGGKRAACAASPAHQACVRRHPGCVRHDPRRPPHPPPSRNGIESALRRASRPRKSRPQGGRGAASTIGGVLPDIVGRRVTPFGWCRRRSCRCGDPARYRRKPSAPR
jgi:hypothetical protein